MYSQFAQISMGEHLSPAHFNVVVKHPKKMFWGSFSFAGVGSLMPTEGMINSDKYIDVIENKVIPDMRRAFSDGGGIFQQDLAPFHLFTKVKTISENTN